MMQLRAGRIRAREAMRRLKDKRAHDTSAMFLRYCSYWARDRYGMAPPDGIAIRLCSTHTQLDSSMYKSAWSEMVEGRDDEGNREVAMQRLIEQASQYYPHLTPDFIRALPGRW